MRQRLYGGVGSPAREGAVLPDPIKIANQNYYIFIQTKPLSNLQIITE